MDLIPRLPVFRLPRWLHKRLERWARAKIKTRPNEIIERGNVRYLDRWHIVKTPLLKVYLHRFRAPDQDFELHDHPFAFVSIGLRGWYSEQFMKPRDVVSRYSLQGPRWLRWRGPRSRHRVYYLHGYDFNGNPDPMPRPPKPVTLVITGPTFRRWGFYCDDGRRLTPKEHAEANCETRALAKTAPWCQIGYHDKIDV